MPPKPRPYSLEGLRLHPSAQPVVTSMEEARAAADIAVELAGKLKFPEYRPILDVCRTQNLNADDVLFFLGSLTDQSGAPVSRSGNQIARFMMDWVMQQHERGLRPLPEGETLGPEQYFAATFRFMFIHFLGKAPKLLIPEAKKYYRTSPPLIYFSDIVRNGETDQGFKPLESMLGLTEIGKKMYYRLLLQLGNLSRSFVGNDETLRPENFDKAARSTYKKRFEQAFPTMLDFAGIHPISK